MNKKEEKEERKTYYFVSIRFLLLSVHYFRCQLFGCVLQTNERNSFSELQPNQNRKIEWRERERTDRRKAYILPDKILQCMCACPVWAYLQKAYFPIYINIVAYLCAQVFLNAHLRQCCVYLCVMYVYYSVISTVCTV